MLVREGEGVEGEPFGDTQKTIVIDAARAGGQLGIQPFLSQPNRRFEAQVYESSLIGEPSRSTAVDRIGSYEAGSLIVVRRGRALRAQHETMNDLAATHGVSPETI